MVPLHLRCKVLFCVALFGATQYEESCRVLFSSYWCACVRGAELRTGMGSAVELWSDLGRGCRLSVAGCRLWSLAAGCRLPVASCRLPALLLIASSERGENGRQCRKEGRLERRGVERRGERTRQECGKGVSVDRRKGWTGGGAERRRG